MATFDVDFFFARGDSNSANNPNLNVPNQNQVPLTTLEFVESDGTSNVRLDFEGGGIDPDTQVIVNGEPAQDFVFEFAGSLPFINRLENVAGFDLSGLRTAVITVDGQRFFFLFGTDLTEAEMEAVMDAFPNGAVPLEVDPPGDVGICFAADVPIDTPEGPRPAGDLSVGDTVCTDDGDLPIVWVGKRHLSYAELVACPDLQPVEIAPDAIAPGCPTQTLTVSPAHRIFLSTWRVSLATGQDSALCSARQLVRNGRGKVIMPKDGITYVHIMLTSHRLLSSLGMQSESLMPGIRAQAAMSTDQRRELNAVFGTKWIKDAPPKPMPPTLTAPAAATILRN